MVKILLIFHLIHLNNKNVTIELKGSEIDCPNFQPDFVFTSPPYFNAEKYDLKNNSEALHKVAEMYLDDFFITE